MAKCPYCGEALPPPKPRGAASPDWIDGMKLHYPKRAGSQNWRAMQRAANARLAEGHDSDEFLAGAARYRAYCDVTGTTGTQFVMQAATFLGPSKPFLEAWEPPPSKAETRLTQNLAASKEWLDASE